MTATKDTLIWIHAQLVKVLDMGAVRDVGEVTFKGARDELQNLINTYADPVAPAPVVVTQEQDDRILELVSNLQEKLDGMITAGASTENMLLAVSEKLDGMEDVLAALALPDAAPAEQPA